LCLSSWLFPLPEPRLILAFEETDSRLAILLLIGAKPIEKLDYIIKVRNNRAHDNQYAF
jgi:hypothetical protein